MNIEIEQFKQEIDGLPILVEGKNDKKPLMQLGFENIFTISGNTLQNIVDHISKKYDSVIILTDFDSEGERKAKMLIKLFTSFGTKTFERFRRRFRFIFKVVKIEEINALVKKSGFH